MLIDTTYFVGEILIPGLTGDNIIVTGNVEEVTRFIKKYEKEYLLHELWVELYNAFVSGLNEDPVEQRWKNLRALLTDSEIPYSPIAEYIYYHIMRDRMTSSTGLGSEVEATAENSSIATNTHKMVRAYNSAVRTGRFIRTWVANRMTVYPEFYRSGNYTLTTVNSFGI